MTEYQWAYCSKFLLSPKVSIQRSGFVVSPIYGKIKFLLEMNKLIIFDIN